MSKVADGATTRRERLLDMMQYIRSFMPDGVNLTNIQLHMSLAHGLTPKRTSSYVYELQMAGVIKFDAGKIFMDLKRFKKLMDLMGSGFDLSSDLPEED